METASGYSSKCSQSQHWARYTVDNGARSRSLSLAAFVLMMMLMETKSFREKFFNLSGLLDGFNDDGIRQVLSSLLLGKFFTSSSSFHASLSF